MLGWIFDSPHSRPPNVNHHHQSPYIAEAWWWHVCISTLWRRDGKVLWWRLQACTLPSDESLLISSTPVLSSSSSSPLTSVPSSSPLTSVPSSLSSSSSSPWPSYSSQPSVIFFKLSPEGTMWKSVEEIMILIKFWRNLGSPSSCSKTNVVNLHFTQSLTSQEIAFNSILLFKETQ